MRLRYLHIRNYPPLEDVAICFGKPVLPERECAIRFVVGVNGSGKTHLLQAIAETFLALARQQQPHFPVTLAWELGEGDHRQTLVFYNPGHGTYPGWWQSQKIILDGAKKDDWDDLLTGLPTGMQGWEPLIRDGNWPSKGVGLPMTVLAYTTGCLDPWQWIFRREPPATDVDIVSQSEHYDASIERPVGWTRQYELDYQATKNTEESRAEVERLRRLAEEATAKEYDQDLCLLLDPVRIKFALLAVSLSQAMREYRQYTTDESIQVFMQQIRTSSDSGHGLRRLLSQVGWVWPVSVVLQIDYNPGTWGEREAMQKRGIFQALYLLANEVVREPEPSTVRRLFFDLKDKCRLSSHYPARKDVIEEFYGKSALSFDFIGDALQQFLGGAEDSPYDGFKRLMELHRQGILTDIQIAVRKADVDDILLFDELSDGEQVFLGRMALFHLLEGENDALLILDEPEVHFNDKWKREIVDIIDGAIANTANDVLISTHSSIVLTDVFKDEIVLLEKQENGVRRVDLASPTFGADPSEIMMRVFDVPDSVGKRAQEWLENYDWSTLSNEKLEEFIGKIGPGFYRTELRTLLNERTLDAQTD